MSSISLKEIARAANVSTATVSRALHGLPGVSPSKRQQIEKIVAKLGKPVRKRGRQAGASIAGSPAPFGVICILQTDDAYLFATDLFARQVKGIVRNANFHGLDVVVGFGNSLPQVPPCLREKKITGALIFGQAASEEITHHLAGIPTVWVASHANLPASMVMQGNDESGQLAAQYLMEQGHELLAGLYPFHHQVMESRIQAFEIKAKIEGRKVVRIGNGKNPMPKSTGNAFQEFNALLDPLVDELLKLPNRPIGLFIPDDSITAHFYPLLKKRSVALGKDINIISFGNEPSYLAGLDPRPASIDIAPEAFGEQMVETLLWHLRHSKEQRRIRVHIEPFVA